MSYSNVLKAIRNNNFFRYGLPFMLFIIGGSFVLKEFASIRYELSSHKKKIGLSPELLKESGFQLSNKSLEEEYETMVGKVDLDNWKNIRGPRPWETTDPNSSQTSKPVN